MKFKDGEVQESKQVKTLIINDPDGNQLVCRVINR